MRLVNHWFSNKLHQLSIKVLALLCSKVLRRSNHWTRTHSWKLTSSWFCPAWKIWCTQSTHHSTAQRDVSILLNLLCYWIQNAVLISFNHATTDCKTTYKERRSTVCFRGWTAVEGAAGEAQSNVWSPREEADYRAGKTSSGWSETEDKRQQ